jgi:type IV pilus assembly protein PilM
MAFEGQNLVGVDVGSSGVKVAVLKESRGKLELSRFGYEALPPHTVVDGNVMNRGAVVEALRRTLAQAKVTQRDCALSVSGHMVIIKKISVPMMTDDELDEQIPWEAEQHIPFDIKDVQIDHQVLRRRPDQGQMDILLVAAKREEIADYASLATDARLRPLVVDIDAFCLQNLFERTVGLPQAGTVMLLDVGASLTTLNIVSDGISAFTRDIAHGGEAITEEVQKRLGVSRDVAEAYKCGGDGREVVPREVDEVIKNVVDGVAAEIQRSIDFYLATIAEGEIGRVYLSGGTSRIRALAAAIERRARVPVETFDPLQTMTVDAKQVDTTRLHELAPLAGVAMGLSLRRARERRA